MFWKLKQSWKKQQEENICKCLTQREVCNEFAFPSCCCCFPLTAAAQWALCSAHAHPRWNEHSAQRSAQAHPTRWKCHINEHSAQRLSLNQLLSSSLLSFSKSCCWGVMVDFVQAIMASCHTVTLSSYHPAILASWHPGTCSYTMLLSP